MQVRLPILAGRMIGAIGHVLHARERRVLERAHLRQGIGFHVDDLATHGGRTRHKGIAAAAYRLLEQIRDAAVRQLPGYDEAPWEFDTEAA